MILSSAAGSQRLHRSPSGLLRNAIWVHGQRSSLVPHSLPAKASGKRNSSTPGYSTRALARVVLGRCVIWTCGPGERSPKMLGANQLFAIKPRVRSREVRVCCDRVPSRPARKFARDRDGGRRTLSRDTRMSRSRCESQLPRVNRELAGAAARSQEARDTAPVVPGGRTAPSALGRRPARCSPRPREERCWVHKIANVLDTPPRACSPRRMRRCTRL